MTFSRLEKLPRELRDHIYALVLTAPYGLIFKTGKNGVSRMCERRSDHTIFFSSKSGHYPASRLIGGVISACCSFLGDTSGSSFNQIQFCSRLLYHEAHGLEFRYNTILFEDSNNLTAERRCRQVISKTATLKHGQYLKAAICSAQLSSPAAVEARRSLTLIEFCRRHPQASIRLHNPLWSQAQPGFVLFGISYSAIMRHKRESLDRVIHNARIATTIETDFLDLALPPDGMPDNLRLFPCEEQLDKQIFLKACSQAVILHGADSSLWVGLAESWFKDGI
jgi:hypothetical protein